MSDNPSDPMNFLKNLWGGNGFALPGMVAPTLDTDDLDKRITDLKTVEGWLRTNLSMLSMTIQNLEMQRTTVSAVRTMSQMYADQGKAAASEVADADGAPDAGNLGAALWPWTMMQQMQASMQEAAAQAQENAAKSAAAAAAAVQKAPAAAAKTPTQKAAAVGNPTKSSAKKKPLAK